MGLVDHVWRARPPFRSIPDRTPNFVDHFDDVVLQRASIAFAYAIGLVVMSIRNALVHNADRDGDYRLHYPQAGTVRWGPDQGGVILDATGVEVLFRAVTWAVTVIDDPTTEVAARHHRTLDTPSVTPIRKPRTWRALARKATE